MFGEEGKDKFIKTLRQQIADRDARYSKLLKEKTAQDEAFKEKTVAADLLRTKADSEELRAERAESALRSTKDDLAQVKLNVSNLETQLRAQSARAVELEKERGRLEFDLASLSHSGPGPSTTENKLTAHIKSLEQELQRKESELSRATRAPTPKSRRRRSSAGDVDLTLTTQRDDAKHAAEAAQREVAGLKARLSASERERDQAVNGRLAAEKRAVRQTDSLQERVDELQFYLDNAGGSQPAAESEKARSDRDTALARAEELQGKLTEKEGEVEESQKALEAKVKELEELRTGASSAEQRVGELQEKVTVLEAQLARTDGMYSEKVAQVERERDVAQAEIASLQSRIEESILDFQRSSSELETEKNARATLQEQVESLEKKAASMTEAEFAATEARARITQLETEILASASKLADANLALSAAKEAISVAASVRDDLQAKLDAALTGLATANSRMSELEAENAASIGLETQLMSVRNERKRWRETAESYQTEIMEMEQALREEISDLAQKLSIANEDLSRATSDHEAAQTAIKRLEAEILAGSMPNDHEEIVRLRQERDRLSADLQDKVLLLDARDAPNKDGDAPSKEQVEKMTLTIRRLRGERDEFKGQVAFTEDERRFADLAATATNKKLKDAIAQAQRKDTLVSELEMKLASLESRQREIGAPNTQVDELQRKITDLEATTSDLERQLAEAELAHVQRDEKAALVDTLCDEKALLDAKISSLESKIASLEAELCVLTRRLDSTEGERDVAKSQLAELESQAAGLRDRLDSVTADLATEKDARKAAENRTALHATADNGEAQRLLADAQGRVERRDKFIKLLEVDKQKLDFNLKNVQDDFAQLSEAHVALESRLETTMSQDTFDQLSEALDARKTENANLAHNLENARAQATRLQETLESTHVDLESLTTAHARTLAEYKALKADHADAVALNAALHGEKSELAEDARRRSQEAIALVLAVAVHRQAVATVTLRANDLAVQVRTSGDRVAALEAEHSAHKQAQTLALLEELEKTKLALAVAEKKLVVLQATSAELNASTEMTTALESRITDLESALADSASANIDARARTVALEEDLVAAETARAELKARAKELQVRVDEMQDDLDAARTVHDGAAGRAVMLEKELALSREALAAAEDSLARAAADLRAQLDVAAAEAEERLAAVTHEAAQSKAADEQAIADFEAELAAAREQAGADLANATDRIKAAEEEVVSLSEALDSLRVDFNSMRDEHDTAAADAENAMSRAEGLVADVTRLQGDLEVSEELVKAATERIESLVSDLSMASADNSRLSSDLDTATADLQNVQGELEAQRARESDLVAQLDKARSELDDSREVLKAAEDKAAAAEVEARKVASQLNFMERGQVDMSTRLAALRDELVQAQAAVAADAGQAREAARLTEANKAFKAALADAEEDLKYKTASLDAKNLDLEEADDREMELKKQVKKASARADKLSRKVRALESEIETLQNTMENMSPRRTRDIPSIAITPSSSSAAARATAVAIASATQSLPPSAPSLPSTTPRSKRNREAEDESVTREVWVEDGPLPKRNSPPSAGRQPLVAKANRPARKPLTSTERAFMQKRAQMAASTPIERKVSMRSVLGSGTTPGATPGDRRVLGPGAPGSGRPASG
ncbi:hypothetical protein CspeluHIS016_0113300 [Cutaneotrichosporon spelunceum]|uniref:Uncharacterized protein n=1 Tax=Cutaneotrichosporon spelunceum TaxID=1672016 RepID=A0AAD3YAI1_9TREE|nr:hypothetical protein CspeluHIS016_0113300 [Cutaneotrichosporon spelunceum]